LYISHTSTCTSYVSDWKVSRNYWYPLAKWSRVGVPRALLLNIGMGSFWCKKISLLIHWLGITQGALLGDFLLAPASPIEKVALMEGPLSLAPKSETNDDVGKDKVFTLAWNQTRNSSKARYAIHFTMTKFEWRAHSLSRISLSQR